MENQRVADERLSRLYSLFISAFGLGVAYCAPPGAVTAETLRRGLSRGVRPAFLVQLGSLVGDATWAAVALGGAALLARGEAARLALGALGAALLLRLSWSALRDAWTGAGPETRSGVGGDFRAGAALSLTNPWGMVFWLGVGGAMASAGVAEPGAAHFATFFGGFMGGAVLWVFVASGAVAWGRRWVGPGLYRWVNGVCGVALGGFALRLCFEVYQLLP
jgi:chemosensory pili system protein ChpE